MKKKALIVGIGDYGNQQPELTAPLNESEEWRNLLVNKYQFSDDDIRMLANPRATKLGIIERLEWLFADAASDDQLVFVFSGHGARLQRRHPNGTVRDNMDEALLAYPESGQTIEEYALYDDDLVTILLLSRLPPSINITFILDCCFAGGFNLRETDQQAIRIPSTSAAPKRTWITEDGPIIPPDIAHRARTSHAKVRFRFGECKRLLDQNQEPVIVAAVPALETSPVDDFGGKRRTLFGFHLTKALTANPAQAYEAATATVATAMLTNDIPNAPVLSGNRTRFAQPFLH
jgi:hypothetical protein